MPRVTGCCSNANAAGKPAGNTLQSKPLQIGFLHKGFQLSALLLFVILMIPAANALASQTQWTGNHNSEWSNPDNWTNGVPDENTEAIINYIDPNNHEPALETTTTIRRLTMGSNNQTLTIGSGYTLNVAEDMSIGNSGELDVADGAVIVNQETSTGGKISVGDGTITFLDNFTFKGSGIMEIGTGNVIVGAPDPSGIRADFTLDGSATFNLNDGTFKVYGSSTIKNGSFNAGNGEMYFDGDITLEGGGSFHPESSTAYITGNSTIHVAWQDNSTIFFYDLIVEEGSEVTQDANIEVLNDLLAPGPDSFINPGGNSLVVHGNTTYTTNTISGTITLDGEGLEDITVYATGDIEITNTTTDSNGEYQITGIPDGANVTITPVDQRHTFSPEEILFENIQDDISLDFTTTELDSGVLGYIEDNSGNPLPGVTVHCEGNDYDETTTTNAAGFFLFSNFPENSGNREYTITPVLSGYSMDPEDEVVMMFYRQNIGAFEEPFPDELITFIATPIDPSAFYSRQTGNWNEPNTWSVTGHDGPAASQAPQGDKDVFIGGSNGNDHTVTLTGNISLDEGVTLTLYDTGNGAGTLATGGPSNNYQVNGGGSFVLQTGGTLHIASPEGITQSANEGNIRTAIRNYSSGANYVYNGESAQQTGNGLPQNVNDLRIDNPDNVTAQQSHAVNGQLQLVNGLFIMPPGSSLLTTNVSQTGGDLRMQLTIDGKKGWRMITSPVQTDYADLMEGFVTQGFDGSDFPGKQPNLLWFDEEEIGTTNMAWRTPDGLDKDFIGGRGYFFYIFDGAGILDSEGNPTGNQYSDKLPITMDATGLEHANGSTFEFNVTYKDRSNEPITDTDIVEMNTGWNMVGNPSTASINWDDNDGWDTRKNIDETVYVWDPAANSGEGEFLVSNGTTGTLEHGLIAPFQAFWIRANASSPELVMNENAKTLGGAFIGTTAPASKSEEADSGKQADAPVTTRTTRNPIDLEMRLEADSMETHSFVSFSEKGRMGEDPYDGYRLESMNDNWLKLYTTTDQHDKPLVINHLPVDLEGNLRIPMYVEGERNGQKLNGSYHLHWSKPDNWPADWEVVLMDHQEEKAISMGWESSYRFDLYSTKSTVPVNQGREFPMPGQIVASVDKPVTKTSDKPNRFTLVINPNGEFEEPEYSPDTPRLLEPSPNPVRTSTDIIFVMPEAGHVDIRIYDLHGRSLQHLVSREYELGRHSITWSPGRLPAGVYIIEMRSGETREAKKVIVQH